MIYKLADIALWCKGKLIGKNDNSIKFISVDSRSIINHNDTLFFAIRGKNLDGHIYIKDLIDKGVKSFVISDAEFCINIPNLTFIVVEDVVAAMQKIAAVHRNKFNIPVVAVTGSNGKTIVKEWLGFLLGNKYNLARSPRSYNSQTGVPLSVWGLNPQTQIGIFEAGISQPDEMKNLQQVINPKIGVITNIGDAHQQYFTDLQQKAHEKVILFKDCNKIVFNADDEFVVTAIEKINSNSKHISWSLNGNGELNILNVVGNGQTSEIQFEFDNNIYSIVIPFEGKAWVENAITCIATLISLNESPIDFFDRFAELPSVAMRMEVLNGINDCRIINDSYNSDIQALNISLEQLVSQSGSRDTVLIVSDILQSGKPDHVLYSELSDMLRSKGIKHVIGVGKAISSNRGYFSGNTSFFEDTQSLIDSGLLSRFYNKSVLLKGARPFEFEKLVKVMQEKSHNTVFEINLNALESNFNFSRQTVGKSTKIMVMVKAFSYGSGYCEIAHHLQYLKADYLAVAYTDEGVELRKAGIHIPIMVMNPEPDSFALMTEHNLEPELFSLEVFKEFSDFAGNYLNADYPVHLKFDTGMHRLGFMNEDLDVLSTLLCNSKNILISSVFTHLVASDNESFDDFTDTQISLLNQMSKDLNLAKSMKHVLNSSGIVRFPQYHFDMVRLGIGLYGIACDPQNRLEQTGVFKTTISQIRILEEGQTVSYNRSGELKRKSKIATIPVGYADGISRKLGNGSWEMKINDASVPTVGDICMDMCMLDVTDIDVNVGDEVIIISGNDFQKMADVIETIPYEILTGIGQRVKRIYLKE